MFEVYEAQVCFMSTDVLANKEEDEIKKALQVEGKRESARKVSGYKRVWEGEYGKIRDLHRSGGSGFLVAEQVTGLIDALLEDVFEETKLAHEKRYGIFSHPVSIVALGSYGRRMLSPWSKIEFMLLYPQKIKPRILNQFEEIYKEKMLQMFGAIGHLGDYECRSISDTIDKAQGDFEIKNSQFNARLVSGSGKLFSLFSQTYKNYYGNESPGLFIEACSKAQEARWNEYENTLLLQEPDIKNGLGGLKDIESILRMGRAQYDTETIKDLLDSGLIGHEEFHRLENAYNFLLRIANEIHIETGADNNQLSIELQPIVGLNMGYSDPRSAARAAALMKDYFSAAAEIHGQCKCVTNRLQQLNVRFREQYSLKNMVKAQAKQQSTSVNGFLLREKVLYAKTDDLFIANPLNILNAFRYSQIYDATLSPGLKEILKNSLTLIDSDLLKRAEASRIFLSIMHSTGKVYPALKSMHELGVLDLVLPEFEGLSGLVLQKRLHHYTADLHTLNTLRELDSLFSHEAGISTIYENTLRNATHPFLLYLTLLLHHVDEETTDKINAREVACQALNRLGVIESHQRTILKVIRNSQYMLDYAQSDEFQKEDSVEEFLANLGSKDLLRHLFVFTYCDTKGMSQTAWTSEKEEAHIGLYRLCLKYLKKHPDFYRSVYDALRQRYRKLLEKHFPRMEEDELFNATKQYHNRYLLDYSDAEKLMHMDLMEQLKSRLSATDCSGTLLPEIHWEESQGDNTLTVTLITWDRPGLLYQIAGAFTALGLNIVSTKINTREDRLILDTFYLEKANWENMRESGLQKAFEKKVNEIILNDINPEPARPFLKRIIPFSACSAKAQINIQYNEEKQLTYVEIQTSDRQGLLRDVSKTFNNQGFNVTFAKIRTDCAVSTDTFFIEKNNPDEPTTTKDLVELREKLTEALQGY